MRSPRPASEATQKSCAAGADWGVRAAGDGLHSSSQNSVMTVVYAREVAIDVGSSSGADSDEQRGAGALRRDPDPNRAEQVRRG